MKLVALPAVLSLGAIGTLAVASSPVQAQYVAIPVTNGSFAITNVGGNLRYTAMPTFLSPAGTLTITAANPNRMSFNIASPITTNTPVGVIGFLTGSVSLNDGRTGTFTDASFSLRGTATVTGVPSLSLPPFATSFMGISNGVLPNGATLSYTVQSGAVHIPATSLSTYSTPQVTIPISGGSFTLTDPAGTGNATVRLNSVLTPVGTANLTLNAPNLSTASGCCGYVTYYERPALTAGLTGLANGTVDFRDGRTATVTDRLVSLSANTQMSAVPPGYYVQGASLLSAPATIQGTITGGSISVPASAVTTSAGPVQPPAAVVEQQVVASPPVAPPSVPSSKPQQLTFGFANPVTARLIQEFINPQPLSSKQPVPLAPEDRPEAERSALEFSRIHPGLQGRP